MCFTQWPAKPNLLAIFLTLTHSILSYRLDIPEVDSLHKTEHSSIAHIKLLLHGGLSTSIFHIRHNNNDSTVVLNNLTILVLDHILLQGWCSGESIRLPLMWSEFDFHFRCYMSHCFCFFSLLRGFLLRSSDFPTSSKINFFFLQIPMRSKSEGHRFISEQFNVIKHDKVDLFIELGLPSQRYIFLGSHPRRIQGYQTSETSFHKDLVLLTFKPHP